MTKDSIFSENALRKTQLFYLVVKLTKPFAVEKASTRRKAKRGIGTIFFMLIITVMS